MASSVVNGVAVDWSQVEITIAGQGIVLGGTKSISYGRTKDVAYAYGRGSKPYDYTDGVDNFDDVEMEVSLTDWQTLENSFGKEDIYKKTSKFDVSVNYVVADATYNDTLIGCRVVGAKKAPAQGPDPIMVTVTMKLLDMK